MPFGGPKKSPRTSIVKVIFPFGPLRSARMFLEIRNVLSVKIHFLTNIKCTWSHLDNTSHCIDCSVESYKISVIHFGSMLPNLNGHWSDFNS